MIKDEKRDLLADSCLIATDGRITTVSGVVSDCRKNVKGNGIKLCSGCDILTVSLPTQNSQAHRRLEKSTYEKYKFQCY
jgi:hypothetical protein